MEEAAIGPVRAIREKLVDMLADSFWFQKLVGADSRAESLTFIHTPFLRADLVKFDQPFACVSRNDGSAVTWQRETAGPVPVYTATGEMRISIFDQAGSEKPSEADADFGDILDGVAVDLMQQSAYDTNVTIDTLTVMGPMESKFEEQPDLGAFWCGHVIVGWSNT